MSVLEKITHELNIKAQCKELGVGLWSCPQFLFMIMGLVVIGMIVITYIVGLQYVDAEIVVLIILLGTGFMLIVAFAIIRSFERVVHLRRREALQAQEILELKDQFVFIAAHELRTPANAIKWGLDLLKSERPELIREDPQLFDIMGRANNRLLTLVDDLLQVSRIESGTIRIELKEVSTPDVLREACDELLPLAGKQDVTIACSFDTFPPVYADAIRLKEVLVNLISNAIKYSPEHGTVTIEKEAADGQVVVSIKNSGVGLSREEQKHVFEKFWRSKQVHDIEGTGLGLFITKHLVELMGGRIWFASIPNQETMFSFSLKAAQGSSFAERS